MFEGKILCPAATPLPDAASGAVRRELSWGDLSARLSAARDFRAAMQGADDTGAASFDAGSARWIAAHESLPDDEGGVNREPSANRKWVAGNIVPAIQNSAQALPASRGTE